MSDVHTRLQAIFREVFGPEVEIHDGLTADMTEGWDSLRHITLIYAIEEDFDIEFTQDEMVDLANVGELKTSIANKVVS